MWLPAANFQPQRPKGEQHPAQERGGIAVSGSRNAGLYVRIQLPRARVTAVDSTPRTLIP